MIKDGNIEIMLCKSKPENCICWCFYFSFKQNKCMLKGGKNNE
jgi:hypothetical protein